MSEDRPDLGKSRRQFLKLTGLTIAGLILSEGAERVLYKIASFGLTQPGITDELVTQALHISETAPNSENPNYRSMSAIINEGIAAYTANTGLPVTYNRSADYRDQTYYAQAIERVAKASLLPTLPAEALEQIKNQFPPEAYHAYASSNNRFTQFVDLLPSDSGFFSRFKTANSELFTPAGEIKNYTDYFSAAEQTSKNYLFLARTHIEQLVAESGHPISSSAILAYFLEQNSGQLAQSIYDTSLFLKFMARNDPDTAAGTSDFNTHWMRQHVKDEYQGPSFTDSSIDEESINLVGKPYHSWNLVAMLQFFPVEFIQISGFYRQAVTFKDQGLGKTRSDLQTLQQLRQIDKQLTELSHPIKIT